MRKIKKPRTEEHHRYFKRSHFLCDSLIRSGFAFFVLWLSLVPPARAQVKLLQQSHDFGLLLRADQNWTDFEIHNSGNREAVIFRVEGPANTDVRLSSKTIPPDSSALIRVAVSPTAPGKFRIPLQVFVSAWQVPQTIEIKGEASYTASSLIPCPDFNATHPARDNVFHLSVRNSSNIPLEDAVIRIYQNGRPLGRITSNQFGETDIRLPYGRYFFSVEYQNARLDTALYVNAVNNHLLALIESEPAESVAIDDPAPDEISESAVHIPRENTPADDVVAAPITPLIPEPESPTDELVVSGVMPLRNFKENNLVFLVDVSASMKQRGKLDLLKIAMVQLLDVLRDVDRFALISYSGQTQTLIETQYNLDRQACIEAILNLEAGGSTAGAKAINKAGSLAVKNFVEGGNNQIILATDGAFSEGVDKALKYATRYRRKDVSLSVVGIKCGKFTTDQMTRLAENGGGRFVPVENPEDAGDQLIDEVKISSARH